MKKTAKTLDGRVSITFYPYRKASPVGRHEGAMLEVNEALSLLPEYAVFAMQSILATVAKVSPDNHTCYAIECCRWENGNPIMVRWVVFFHDNTIQIGTDVQEEDW